MKKSLLFILFTVSVSNLFSQANFRFADSTARWNVLMHYPDWFPFTGGAYSTFRYNVAGDTVVNSRNYQKIYGEQQGEQLLRKDSVNRIYRYQTDTSEYLLYDFNMITGDSVKITTNSGPNDYHTVFVGNVDSIYLDRWRKRMFVSVVWGPSTVGHFDIWIDGIGSLDSHFSNPIGQVSPEEDINFTLLCFFENSSLVYHSASYDTCEYNAFVSAIDNVYSKGRLRMGPNPTVDNFVTIQSEASFPEQTTFQLFDITGRMISQEQLSDKTALVKLNGVSKGMYLYTVVTSGQKINSGKLAVQ